MPKRIGFACILLLVLSTSAFAQNVCTVADPTGTPLNVRATPAGRLLPEVFYNGANVTMYETSRDGRGNAAWALVGKPGGNPYGWVFRDYINCEPNVSPPPNTSAPTTAQSPSVQPGVGIGWVKSSDIECDLNNTCSLKNNYAVKGCVNYGIPVYSRPDGKPIGELASEVVAGYEGVVQGENNHGYTYVSYRADSKDLPSLLPFDVKDLHSCG